MAAERRLYIRVDMETSKENSHSQPVCPNLQGCELCVV